MKTDRKNYRFDSHTKPLAIIGIGCMFPQADNAGKFWTNIKDGVDSIVEVPKTHWRSEDYYHQDPKVADKVYAKLGGFLSPVEFNPMDYGILPNAIEAIDTSQLLGLLTVEQALKDAGYSKQVDFDRDKVSVILGVTGSLELIIPLGARLGYPRWREALREAGVDQEIAEDVMQRISDSYVPWQENSFPGLLGNVIAGRIAKHFNFGGTNCVVDAACGSSLSALNLAALELSAGRSDMVVTGGIDTFNDIFMYTCFSKTPALSPSGHARPFDENSDGTTLGEGVGIVVLKRQEDAERDGDKIYALIKGIGSSSDGHGGAIYEPDAKGQAKAIQRAYQPGEVSPETIELIEGHGTGTKVGDAIEVSALNEVFGPASKSWCALGSVKSQIGHTKAAAGAAGLIKAALALFHKTLPATIKVNKPQKNLTSTSTPFYINTESRPWISRSDHPRRAGISAHGFGGSNFHCLLEEYLPYKPIVDWKGDVQVVPFSAADPVELAKMLQQFPKTGDWSQLRLEADHRRHQFLATAPQRLMIVVDKNQTDRASQIKKALTLLEKNQGQQYWDTPDGIFYASGDFSGEIAMLFPGQGAQYPGMLKDLALQFPEFLSTIQDADNAFAANTDTPRGTLTDIIYPRTQFDQAAKEAVKSALCSTDVAQPALGAVSLAACRVLAHFGISANLVAGHSYGELIALCTADVFTPNELFYLSRLRGELMAAGEGDRGAMLAVFAPLELVKGFLTTESLDLVLANRNTPDQGILSGATAEIEKAMVMLNEKGISNKRLEVSAAFHSQFIADAARPFAEKLQSISFKAPGKKVFSNTTGSEYPVSVAAIKALLAKQLASPVDFVAEIETMYQAGARIFVEVGPGARLTGMVKTILGERDHQAVALDTSNGNRSGISDLARLLAQLSVLGRPMDWSLWDEGFAAPQEQVSNKKPGMVVSICGANFYKKPAQRPPLKLKPVATGQQPNQAIPVPETTQRGSLQKAKATPMPADHLQKALQITQQSLQALQNLQNQTASLHQKFLEGQQAAATSLMRLADQQHSLLHGEPVTAQTESQTSDVRPRGEAAEAASAQNMKDLDTKLIPTDVKDLKKGTVSSLLLGIVAEKTGYPVEMLELEMTLDGDLGIDSIKRVEILSALQEKLPTAPAIHPEDLGLLQTLEQIIDYLDNGKPVPSEPTITSDDGKANGHKIKQTLLAVVAEKTGYPMEMLELEMALDTDLGIDSIKRVEILSALQEKLPEIPIVSPEDLGTLQTLGQIVEYLSQGIQQQGLMVPATPQMGQIDRDVVTSTLLEIIADKTGYPVEMLEPEMALDLDLGIDSIKRVEILSALQERLPGTPIIKPDHIGTLQTVKQIIDFLASVTDSANPVPDKHLKRNADPKDIIRQVLQTIPLPANRPTKGLNFVEGTEVWITDDGSTLPDLIGSQLAMLKLNPRKISLAAVDSLELPETLAGLIILAPLKGTDDLFLLNAFKAVRKVEPALQKTAQYGGAFLTTISRMNGHFGLHAKAQVNDPLSGGLAGLCKTAALEWPELHYKALDLEMELNNLSTADSIVNEILTATPLEVGITSQGLLGLELVTKQIDKTSVTIPVQAGDLVVISGGARGVTAEVAIALAAASKATLLLLGRSQMPAKEPAWLSGLTEEADIKKCLIENSNTPLKPLDVAREYKRIAAGREISKTLASINQVGGKAIYRSVDLRDKQTFTAILDEIRNQYGPVKGLIHGAGVLADKLIKEKTPEQFEQVYTTKIEGLRTLLDACTADDLKFMVMFSSSTARFGRIGQVDYAIANEILNKMADQQAKSRPNCRVLSLNWGPWNGGMVTPTLKTVFEQEGIGVIDLQAGADCLLKEISTPPGGPVELVILGESTDMTEKEAVAPHQSVYVSKAFDLDLSVAQYPFLKSHVINGKAVLPVAMIIEWLAHGAIHGNPGLKFQGFNDLRIHKGVMIEPEQVYPLQVMTGKVIKSDGLYVVPVELSGIDSQGKQVSHARTKVVLANILADRKPAAAKLTLSDYPHRIGEIYQAKRLFHGKDFHGIQKIIGYSTEGISAAVNPAPSPNLWIEQPLRNSWFADPLVIDSSFQLLILWSLEQFQAGSLPVFAGRYRQYQEKFPQAGVEIRARIKGQNSNRAHADIDFIDPLKGLLIARLENYECVIDTSLKSTFQHNVLIGVAGR